MTANFQHWRQSVLTLFGSYIGTFGGTAPDCTVPHDTPELIWHEFTNY